MQSKMIRTWRAMWQPIPDKSEGRTWRAPGQLESKTWATVYEMDQQKTQPELGLLTHTAQMSSTVDMVSQPFWDIAL